MARPKGSKNKPKKVEEAPKVEAKVEAPTYYVVKQSFKMAGKYYTVGEKHESLPKEIVKRFC